MNLAFLNNEFTVINLDAWEVVESKTLIELDTLIKSLKQG